MWAWPAASGPQDKRPRPHPLSSTHGPSPGSAFHDNSSNPISRIAYISATDMHRTWERHLGLTAVIVGGAGMGYEAAELLSLSKVCALPRAIFSDLGLCAPELKSTWAILMAGDDGSATHAWELFDGGIALLNCKGSSAHVTAQLKPYCKHLGEDFLHSKLLRNILVMAGIALFLNAVGFAAGGVTAGSLASLAQSYIYGGQTCGVFSILQSIGAHLFSVPWLTFFVVPAVAVVAEVVVPKVVKVARKVVSWIWSRWR